MSLSLLTLGRADASIALLSLNRSLSMSLSLLTLGRADASIALLSLNRSLSMSLSLRGKDGVILLYDCCNNFCLFHRYILL